MSQSQKIRLDLPLLLPDIPDAQDACVIRLQERMTGRPGVAQAHVVGVDEGKPQLCVHYDPEVISVARLRELVISSGIEITDRYAHFLGTVPGPMHARAAERIASQLRALTGVIEAEVSAAGAMRIEYDRTAVDLADMHKRLNALGVAVSAVAKRSSEAGSSSTVRQADAGGGHDHGNGHDHGDDHKEDRKDHKGHKHDEDDGEGEEGHDHGGPFGEKSELILAAIAGGLLLAGLLCGRSMLFPSWLPTALYAASYFFGGFFTVREAIENLRARRFEIDTLMLVAAAGAAALGEWGEGALLLFLFSLGHSLEHYAMGRARRAIEALAKLAPETATVRRGTGTEVVPLNQLQVGDVVIVKPNERLPADGAVVVGTSSINQAPVTGESVPVDKKPVENGQAAVEGFERLPAENRVFAGTINGAGAIEVMVARKSDQSTMARVVKMVTEAEAQRSPTQQFTEKFERIFVPAVLALVVLLLFAGLVVDEPFSATFYRAMAVLVAASPCALAISVPSAVLSGVARAARGGVLVKGGGPLENLGTLTSIAFDKTGTLTEGRPKLTDVAAANGATEEELLSVALAVEAHSDHPLASAIVDGARERLKDAAALQASEVKSITGRGVQAQVGGETVYIGKPVLFTELPDSSMPADVDSLNRKLVDDGRTTMVVRKANRFLGVLGVMDTPRPAAKQVTESLRKLGIERLIMISGDNQKVADAVAQAVGLTEARGDLMPEQKVEEIKKLRAEHGKVAMVGDGVNDAPAMANATVGIAMGAAGSDVALETADVALMADDLAQLPFAVGISRSTSRIIKQNLWVSLGVVAVLIPATIFGLNIGAAVIFHEGSTLLVVVNALRLLAYKAA
ncbi:heavy metal translocating P-type ATPase [Pelomonas sp. V22]|uniref:heavy metal translocating P-type ATPase n=1 Tax=Pelomonas sp. V22 TaxID=2822139 RepID=UPI0024A7BAA5|nr:heavy metal translocating P-type ATPase [Pelomonas sp. V22]MDI4635247.1 heavy metal translocating P-type ATPase [Pelomonas sp. V22]